MKQQNNSSQIRVSLIAAMDNENAIGRNDDIPWHYPEDLSRFQNITTGSAVIMGRVTYESIMEKNDGPLENRTSIVLTNSPERVDTPDNDGMNELVTATTVHTASRVEEALAVAGTTGSEVVYVAGGESVYEQYLTIADELIITRVDMSVENADAHFPEWDDENWKNTITKKAENNDLTFKRYTRA